MNWRQFIFALMTVPLVADALPGFYNVNLSQIPAAVQSAAKHTFQITVPGGNKEFDKKQLEKLKLLLPQMVKTGDLTLAERILVEKQILDCTNSTGNRCTLSVEFKRSTAFTLVNGQIGTVLHAIEHNILSQLDQPENRKKPQLKKQELLLSMQIPAVIQTDGVLAQFVQFKIVKIVPEALELIIAGEEIPHAIDLIVLASSQFQPTSGIKVGSVQPQVGDTIYTIGYPAETADRLKRASVPDANGEMRVVVGKKLATKEGYARQKNDFSKLSAPLQAFFEKALLITDADAQNGLSGAPMLNANGEVVAIFGTGWPDKTTFDPLKMAIGVNFSILGTN